MFKLSSKIICLFLLIFSSGVGSIAFAEENRERPQSITEEKKNDKALAEVNGHPIPESIFKQELKNVLFGLGHGELSPGRMEEIKKEVLDRLIGKELIFQKARQEKLNPYDLVKKEVYDRVSVQKEEIADYYQKHQEEFMRPEGVRLRHLLVRVDPSGSNEDWKKGYEKALDLSDRANKGEDFTELIKKHSDEETRYFGGDLRIQYKGQMMMAEFEPVAFTLKIKEVSRPIQTLYGFSLIQIVEKIPPEPVPFAEINQEKIKEILVKGKEAKRYQEWMGDLKRQADIKVYPN